MTDSPSFCAVIDPSIYGVSELDFGTLQLTHLVQFSIRFISNDFEDNC